MNGVKCSAKHKPRTSMAEMICFLAHNAETLDHNARSPFQNQGSRKILRIRTTS